MEFPHDQQAVLTAFRGLPRAPRKAGREPFRLDSLVEVLVERHQIGAPSAQETIMAHWRSIVGEKHAARCAPRSLDHRGCLVIAVANPTIRNELNFHRREILQRLQRLPLNGAVRDVRLVAG